MLYTWPEKIGNTRTHHRLADFLKDRCGQRCYPQKTATAWLLLSMSPPCAAAASCRGCLESAHQKLCRGPSSVRRGGRAVKVRALIVLRR